VGMEIGVASAISRDGEGKPNDLSLVEGTNYLTANLFSNNKHAQGNQFDVGEIPDFLLQADAGSHFVQTLTWANHYTGFGQRFICSWSLAWRQRESSSSSVASWGERPEELSCCSIH